LTASTAFTGDVLPMYGAAMPFRPKLNPPPDNPEQLKRIMGGMARERPADIIALLLITVIAIAVRTYYLSLPIKYDEAFTFLEYARQPLWNSISNYSSTNNHLLNTLFIHFSTSVLGNHAWALRLSDFAFGCLLVPATYVLGRIFSKSEAALVAAALVAGSPKLVEYSVNARGYTLLAFLSIALVAIGFRLISSANVMAWAGFVGVAALGFFTVPTMIYVYAAVVLWMSVKSGWDRLVLKKIFIASGATLSVTAVLYSPVVIESGLRALLFNRFIRPLALHDLIHQVPMLAFAVWNSWTAAVPGPLVVALLIGLSIGMLYNKDLFQLLFSFATAAITLIAVQRVIPPSRVFLFGLPIIAICASYGFVHLLGRWPGKFRLALLRVSAVVLAAWMGWAVVRGESVLASEETGSFQDAAEVINFLDSVATPDDLVLMVLPVDQPFKYYLQSRATDWRQGSGRSAFKRLIVVLRDHHGPVAASPIDWHPITLNDIKRFHEVRSEPKLVFIGAYTSMYIADGATVEHAFCEVFCFHKTRIER
jgi:hypothetical protein